MARPSMGDGKFWLAGRRPAAKDAEPLRSFSVGGQFYTGQSILLDPTHPEAFNGRGLVRLKRCNYTAALADIDRAIQLDPTNADYRDNRRTVLAYKSAAENQVASFDEVIGRNPRFAEAYFHRANGKNCAGDYVGALADYDWIINFRNKVEPSEVDHDRAILAYSRLFRHLILRRLGRIDTDDLAHQLPSWADGWPKTVGLFLVGKINQEDFLRQSIATTASMAAILPTRVSGMDLYPGEDGGLSYIYAQSGESYSIGVAGQRYVCEINYFSGMIDLLEGRTEAAKKRFNACLDCGENLLFESGFSRSELKVLEK